MAAPVEESDRIVALDVLRGFALLGILVMNVQVFAMPPSTYTNPASFGDLEGINRATWVVSHVFADQKFMAIFTMLFGAGVCLFADRAKSAGTYYRRTLILLGVGIAHAYLLFQGDILTAYGLCGLWLYLFRNAKPRTLLIVGGLIVLVPSALSVLIGASIPEMPPDALAGMAKGWAPSADLQAANIQGMRGGFVEQVTTRLPHTIGMHAIVLPAFILWRATGMMLIGMALYKTGLLTGKLDTASYRRLALFGIPIGLAASGYGVMRNFQADWSLEFSMFFGGLPNYWGSIATSLGYVGVVMLVVRLGLLRGLQARLAAAGRMAFTNYIAQSVLCVLIFNFGGLYGQVPRWQQFLFALAVIVAQLWYSQAWLARYRYGPLEWLWRFATYGKLPAMRRETT